MCRVYSGHNSILVAPSELERDPTVWLTAVSQYKVRDTFCSYGVMEMCTRGLGATTPALKVHLLFYSNLSELLVLHLYFSVPHTFYVLYFF